MNELFSRDDTIRVCMFVLQNWPGIVTSDLRMIKRPSLTWLCSAIFVTFSNRSTHLRTNPNRREDVAWNVYRYSGPIWALRIRWNLLERSNIGSRHLRQYNPSSVPESADQLPWGRLLNLIFILIRTFGFESNLNHSTHRCFREFQKNLLHSVDRRQTRKNRRQTCPLWTWACWKS